MESGEAVAGSERLLEASAEGRRENPVRARIQAKCLALFDAYTMQSDVQELTQAVAELRKAILPAAEEGDIFLRMLGVGSISLLGAIVQQHLQTSDEICRDSLWILSNTLFMHSQVHYASELLPAFRDAFNYSKNAECVELAVQCLGNIASTSMSLRIAVASLALNESFANRLMDTSVDISMRRQLAFYARTMSGSLAWEVLDAVRPLLGAASSCVSRGWQVEDHEILRDSLWTLSGCANCGPGTVVSRDGVFEISFCEHGEDEAMDAVFATGILPTILQMGLQDGLPEDLLAPIICMITSILRVLGPDDIALRLQGHWLPLFYRALQCEDAETRRSAGSLPGGAEEIVAHDDLFDSILRVIVEGRNREAVRDATEFFCDLVSYDRRWFLERCPVAGALLCALHSDDERSQRKASLGLKSILKERLSNCVRSLRGAREVRIPNSFMDPQSLITILNGDMFEPKQLSGVAWLHFALGVPDRKRTDDGTMIDVLEQCTCPASLVYRIHALRSITLLAGLTSVLRWRFTFERFWLTLDCWRLVWQMVFI